MESIKLCPFNVPLAFYRSKKTCFLSWAESIPRPIYNKQPITAPARTTRPRLAVIRKGCYRPELLPKRESSSPHSLDGWLSVLPLIVLSLWLAVDALRSRQAQDRRQAGSSRATSPPISTSASPRGPVHCRCWQIPPDRRSGAMGRAVPGGTVLRQGLPHAVRMEHSSVGKSPTFSARGTGGGHRSMRVAARAPPLFNLHHMNGRLYSPLPPVAGRR